MSRLPLRRELKAVAVDTVRLISSPSTRNGTAISLIAMRTNLLCLPVRSLKQSFISSCHNHENITNLGCRIRWLLSITSILLALFGQISQVQAANSLGECYVTVNVSGGTLPAGWSYQLQYCDTDSRWYNGASGTSTQTYYKQQGDWLNRSVQWRCQLKFNFTDYGTAQTNTCFAGSDTVSFSVTAPTTINPPTITGDPVSQSVSVGASVTFTVTASGTAPLSYQWRKNGDNIDTAKAASHTISSVSAADAGNYSCHVSNTSGDSTSQEAVLTVCAFSSNEYFVSSSGNDAACGSLSTPFATIQKGIDTATDGCTVWVLPGNYSGIGNRAINMRGKKIKLRSTDGPVSTIINCERNQAIIAESGERTTTSIDGFTITNGYVSNGRDWSGLGVVHMENASLLIENCVFHSNEARTSYVTSSASIILKTEGFSHSAIVQNCLFFNNIVTGIGWTIYGGGYGSIIGSIGGTSPIGVNNCTISNNTINSSGGPTAPIQIFYGADIGLVKNTIVWGNSPVSMPSGTIDTFSTIRMYPAGGISENPTTILYSLANGGITPYGGTGNKIGIDPLFIDTSSNNFALQVGSPAINTGSPSDSDPDGTIIDMGYRQDRFVGYDTDGDGFDDLFEINNGFDPNSSASSPDSNSSIRESRKSVIEFSFYAAKNISYRIEVSADLSRWSAVEDEIIGNGGKIVRSFSTISHPRRFFRVYRN